MAGQTVFVMQVSGFVNALSGNVSMQQQQLSEPITDQETVSPTQSCPKCSIENLLYIKT